MNVVIPKEKMCVLAMYAQLENHEEVVTSILCGWKCSPTCYVQVTNEYTVSAPRTLLGFVYSYSGETLTPL
jgi:hypothetical protein